MKIFKFMLAGCICATGVPLHAMVELKNQDELNKTLVNAYEKNDINAFTNALERGANPNVQVGDVISKPLILEIYEAMGEGLSSLSSKRLKRDDNKFLSMLFQHPEININQKSEHGETILHRAAKKLDENMIYRLVELPGIDINILSGGAVDSVLSKVLSESSNSGNHEKIKRIVRFLLAHGADPSLKGNKTSYDRDAYFWVPSYYPEFIKMLKEGRADYLKKHVQQVQEATGFATPLSRLVSEYAVGVKPVPQESQDAQSKSAQQETKAARALTQDEQRQADKRLIEAVKRGNLSEMQAAITAGAHVNFKSEYHNTPLILAALDGDVAIVKYLLQAPKIAVNQVNAGGRTALIETIVNNKQSLANKLEIIELLLNKGADVHVRDADKLNAYDYAEKMPAIREVLERSQMAMPDVD